MKQNASVMPERLYSLDNNMSLEKIIQAKNNKTPLIGKVVFWNSKSKSLEVDLGNGYIGYIPIEYASIYPTLLPDGRLTPSIRAIISKTVIVTVLDILSSGENHKITLSRIDTMLSAFDFISNSIGKEIKCCVSSISSFGIFVDVGNGVIGRIGFIDLCTSRLHHFSDIGFKIGDEITLKVLSVNDKFQVCLNYKDQFENLSFKLNTDDLIEATILEPINEDGYYVFVNPNTPAIIDVPCFVPCKYGDRVLARVKNHRQNHPEQLRLSFVSFID